MLCNTVIFVLYQFFFLIFLTGEERQIGDVRTSKAPALTAYFCRPYICYSGRSCRHGVLHFGLKTAGLLLRFAIVPLGVLVLPRLYMNKRALNGTHARPRVHEPSSCAIPTSRALHCGLFWRRRAGGKGGGCRYSVKAGLLRALACAHARAMIRRRTGGRETGSTAPGPAGARHGGCCVCARNTTPRAAGDVALAFFSTSPACACTRARRSRPS